MQRFQAKREGLEKIIGALCPKIKIKFERAKLEAMDCHCIWTGGHRFEVEYHTERYIMDLEETTCGCWVWDLIGIPCSHGAVAIMFIRKEA